MTKSTSYWFCNLVKKRIIHIFAGLFIVLIAFSQLQYDSSLKLLVTTKVTATLERSPRIGSMNAEKSDDALKSSILSTSSASSKNYCKQRFSSSSSEFDGISLFTAVMNRNDQLIRSLNNWLQVHKVEEIVIVDWSSTPSVKETVIDTHPEYANDPRIRLIVVPNQSRWVLTRACNLAAFQTRGKYIMKVDSDVFLSPDFFEQHDLPDASFFAGNWKLARTENERHLNGIFYGKRTDFVALNGYDERIVAYGWDDDDLYLRLEKIPLRRLQFNADLLHHDEHGDELRIGHQRKTIQELSGIGDKSTYIRNSVSRAASEFPDVQILRNKNLLSVAPNWTVHDKTMICKMKELDDRSCSCEPISFSPSLSSVVSTQLYEEVTVQVMRNVLKYTSKLPLDLINSMGSVERLVNQLDLHYWNRPRYLVVHVQNGLGNRMRAVASAKVLANKIHRPLRIIWSLDEHVNATFNDLFQNSDFDVASEFDPREIVSQHFDVYNDMEDGNRGVYINPESRKHIYVKTAHILNNTMGDEDEVNYVLRNLVPVMSVFRLMAPFKVTNTIGIHIRMNVLNFETDGGTNDAIQKPCHYNNYFPLMTKKIDEFEVSTESSEEILNSDSDDIIPGLLPGLINGGHDLDIADDGVDPKVKLSKNAVDKSDDMLSFFVSTDNEEAVNELRKFFGEERIQYLARNCNDRSKDCLYYALADMYLLSQTRSIFGSSWSSFTEVAGRLGHVKIDEACKQDNIAVDLHNDDSMNSTSSICSPDRIHLVIQYPLLDQMLQPNPPEKILQRQKEYTDTLVRNLVHPQVTEIHLLVETEETRAYLLSQNLSDRCNKLKINVIKQRMKYRDAFEFASQPQFEKKIFMIMNADIYTGMGFQLVEKSELNNTVYALTRHEKNPGPMKEGKCGLDLCEHYKNAKGGYLSHDAFLFLSPIAANFPKNVDFLPNLMGAENVVVHELKKHGYKLLNPCKTLWTYHNHCSNVRPDLTKVVAVVAPSQTTTIQIEPTLKSEKEVLKSDAPLTYVPSSKETSYNVTKERIDLQRCGKIHCGDGWVHDGPTFLVKTKNVES